MGKNKQQVPRLRFPGFNDAWEQRKFKELVFLRSETVESQDYSVDIELENLESNTGRIIGNTSVRTMSNTLFKKGDILFGKLRPYLNKWRFADEEGVKSGEIWAFSCREGYSNRFIYCVIQSNGFLDEVNITSGTKMPRADWKTVSNIKITIPTIEEQTTIGNFFRQLDAAIASHQRKLERTNKLKKSLLQKMFPKDGEAFPELRFPDFTDAWEQRKLGDVVDIVGGGTPETTNSAYWNGDIDWYSPTEIGAKVYANGSVKKITTLGLEKSSAKILPANKTILFTSRAGIGDMAILQKQGATNQGFQSFIVRDGINIYFLYSMGKRIKDFALKNASGSTFLEVSKNQLVKMDVFMPSEKEQIAIGNFFRQLDEAIASHQRKLEHMQTLKKGLLQQMFV